MTASSPFVCDTSDMISPRPSDDTMGTSSPSFTPLRPGPLRCCGRTPRQGCGVSRRCLRELRSPLRFAERLGRLKLRDLAPGRSRRAQDVLLPSWGMNHQIVARLEHLRHHQARASKVDLAARALVMVDRYHEARRIVIAGSRPSGPGDDPPRASRPGARDSHLRRSCCTPAPCDAWRRYPRRRVPTRPD